MGFILVVEHLQRLLQLAQHGHFPKNHAFHLDATIYVIQAVLAIDIKTIFNHQQSTALCLFPLVG